MKKSALPKPGAILEGRVTRVRDGDTIEVNGVAIRLSALDCPERGTREGEHANRLAQQFLNTNAVCELTGAKTYDRLVGYCSIENQDFGLFMMFNSACKLWKKYDVWGRY
ncbi:thermonuclease family protein [Rhodobacteraceae bacterium IMCC15231]|nr:thermonuclease family protein [Rhodobacteraceae bacterium IMCC15231]